MKGWLNATLEKLCIIGDGNHSSKYPKKSEMVEDGVPFIRGTNLTDGQISGEDILYISEEKHQQLKKGHLEKDDVLFTNRGDIGKVAIVDERFHGANCNSQLAWFRCRQNLLPKYLFYFLQSDRMRKYFSQTKSGAALQQFTIRMIKSVIVSYPPIAEQKQIVAILDEAFEGIDSAIVNTERNLANARELFESYLNAIFTRKGDEWVDTEIQKHIKFIDYRGRTPKKTETGMRLITAKNVKMGYLQLEPQEFVNPDIYDDWMTRGIPNEGDVLFTTEAPLGNVAQLDTSEKVVFAQRVIIMQPDAAVLNSSFLKFMLLSKVMQKRIHDKGTGATAKGIKASLLKKIEISFPKDLLVQEEIVSRLDELEEQAQRLEAIYQQKLAALNELKQSILQKAFSGELTAEVGDAAGSGAKEVVAAQVA